MTIVTSQRPLLHVQDLYAGYQGFDILSGVSLYVDPGEVVCLIGPNGAGKSTVFNAIYGFIKVRLGRVTFDGHDVTGYQPQDVLDAGITIVPQVRSVFPQMSVYENLEMGMYRERDRHLVRTRIEFVLELFPSLAQRTKQAAGTLSGGEQRILEIGRALMWQPKLMLLDEPSAGLAPVIAREIFRNLLTLNREVGLTLLMIEQNVRQGLKISDRGYVLELGQKTREGTGQELLDSVEILQTIMGDIER